MNVLPLKDISTPILLGYALDLSKFAPTNEADIKYRTDILTELASRGVKAGLESVLTGPIN